MALDYLAAGPNGSGQWLTKLVTIDHDTDHIHCKFDCARQSGTTFVDGGFRLMDEEFAGVIGGIDEYFSNATNPHTFNLSYAVALVAGQRVNIVLESSGEPSTSLDTACFRNLIVSADPIP